MAEVEREWALLVYRCSHFWEKRKKFKVKKKKKKKMLSCREWTFFFPRVYF